MTKQWKTWIGVTISVVAIVYVVRGVHWDEVGWSLRRADLGLLALIFVINPTINVVMRAIRWKILLKPYGSVPLAGCTSATAIGLMANNVLPVRIGEFVRAYALSRREEVPTGTAFGGLFVERMLDGFALLTILFFLTLSFPFPDWVDTVVRITVYVFVGFLAFQAVLAFHPQAFIRASRWLTRNLLGGRFEESIERALVTFADGFQLLRRPDLVVLSFVLAFVQWVLISSVYVFGLQAFELGGVGWIGAFFTSCVATLGVAAPSAPGFVGTYEALIVKSLEVFGVDRTTAFSFSAGFHAVTWLGVTLLGFFFFFREGLSWREIEHSEEEMGKELEAEFETVIEPEIEASDL